MSKQRVLPADIYDTIELGAHVNGGIGAGLLGVRVNGMLGDDLVGFCVHGIGAEMEFGCPYGGDACAYGNAGVIGRALSKAEVGYETSDAAVRAINRRRGIKDQDSRVSFEDWCAELGIVRGVA